MKTYFPILVLVVILITTGCEPKKHEKTADEIAATEDSLKRVKEAELAERKARLKETLNTKIQQRRAEMDEKAKASLTFKDASGKTVYYKSEEDPKFAGGEEGMIKYLQDNLQYPETARSRGIEGTVFVDFVIDNKGQVRDVTATESTLDELDPALKDEAVRVVSQMPAWAAGKKSGKAVDVAYSIPITFELQGY